MVRPWTKAEMQWLLSFFSDRPANGKWWGWSGGVLPSAKEMGTNALPIGADVRRSEDRPAEGTGTTLDTDPEVTRKAGHQPWPADKPFPLTPLEAWYVVQGYVVKPAITPTTEQLLALPGWLEGGDAGLWIRE